MSDDTSDDATYSQPSTSRSDGPTSPDTLRRATRWETLAILVVLLILAFVFA
ncbi:hypothetical protein [Streptomyces cinnamoneus]|uniref:Uncharacterized protein n=1 Tax=Streptomyces cinnamoneus TaxID=53446 RepID=A0A918TBC1_STRCJ|nr:hypothetical protein [Streptomyces cinnamoneus]GHC38882.1 hypothetical protein GCM10010507_10660 [Streptomyces cinnamoneus]